MLYVPENRLHMEMYIELNKDTCILCLLWRKHLKTNCNEDQPIFCKVLIKDRGGVVACRVRMIFSSTKLRGFGTVNISG